MSREEIKELSQMLTDGKYDLPMFLQYLRTFAMSGATPEKTILLGILMQSLARFHESDFTACICLVASHVQEASNVEREIGYLYELENLLSSGEFVKFWNQWAIVKDQLPESVHFENRVRISILETIAITIERVQHDRLAAYLDVPVENVKTTIEQAKLQGGHFILMKCTDTHAIFARNEFNFPESNVNQDALKFSDIVTIVERA